METEEIRVPWFGGFGVMKIIGLIFLAALSYFPWVVFGHAELWFSSCVWLMMSTGLLDGRCVINLKTATLKRTIYFIWVLPIFRSTIALRSGGVLYVTFKPSFLDRFNIWHIRDFTTIDLRYGPRDWLQVSQTDRSHGNFEPHMLQRARDISKKMKVRLVVEVDRMAGAIDYKDESAVNPPPELKPNQPS